MHPSTMMKETWVEGALASWPAQWVLSQPSPGDHDLDFKCERNHLQCGTASAGWQPAGLGSGSLGFLGMMQPWITDGLGNTKNTQIASMILG